MESIYSEGVPSRGLNPPFIDNPKWEPQTPTNFGHENFFHIQRIKIRWIQCEIIFQIWAELAQISSENSMHRRPGQTKRRSLENRFCSMAVSNWRSSWYNTLPRSGNCQYFLYSEAENKHFALCRKTMRWSKNDWHLSEWSGRPLLPLNVWADQTTRAGCRVWKYDVCMFVFLSRCGSASTVPSRGT